MSGDGVRPEAPAVRPVATSGETAAARPARSDPGAIPEGDEGRLSNGAEEFLTWLAVERGRARNTLLAYRRDLSGWEGFLRARGLAPEQVGPGVVEEYLARLRAGGRQAASVARALSTVRGYHRFLVDEGFAVSDASVDVARPRLPARLPKALDEEEVLALLGAVTGDGPLALRDRALLELLYGTGARISEAVGLSLGDIHDEDGLVRVLGKGSKERLVPLGRPARAALAAWLGPGGRPRVSPRQWARRGDADAVFLNARGGRLGRQGAWGILRRHAQKVGLQDRVSPHVLRHSCATHMLAHGADIRVVQELLGHASITTTQVYTRLTGEHLRRVYEGAHPRAGATATTPARSVASSGVAGR